MKKSAGRRFRVEFGQVREALSGPIPTLATPFLKDGHIDYRGVHNLIDFTIEEGGARVVVLTHGDSLFTLLSEREICELTRAVVEHTAGRVMTVAAEPGLPTAAAVQFARHVRGLGADMLMVKPPVWGGSCTPDTMAEHYAAVGKQIPLMLVTNVFQQFTVEFCLETLERTMEKTGSVLAMKGDVPGELDQKACRAVKGRMAIWAGGQKQNHIDLLSCGCDGYLSTFISFAPEVTRKYWNAIQAGDIACAQSVIDRYDKPFFDFVGGLPGGVDAGIHGALEVFGIVKRWRRKPYYSLNDDEMKKLATFFKSKDLL